MEETNKNFELPKLDYEKEYARLNYENNILKSKLNEAMKAVEALSDNRGIERIKFLFEIVKNEGMSFTPDFINKAVAEIEEAIYPKEEEKHE